MNTVSKPLAVGDPIPMFELKDQNGNLVDIKQYLNNSALVIYFYPKDDTPGCTKEACSFRDSYETFTDAGAQVIGISADSPASHKKFAEKYRLPFTLLSDEKNKVRNAFGVKGNLFGLIPGRVTYIVDKNGIVRHIFNSQFEATKHVDEAKGFLKQL